LKDDAVGSAPWATRADEGLTASRRRPGPSSPVTLDRGERSGVGFAGSGRGDPRDVERAAGREDEAGDRISQGQGVRETVGVGASEPDAYLDKLAQRTDERGAVTPPLDIASCAEDGASGSAASVARGLFGGDLVGMGCDSTRSISRTVSQKCTAWPTTRNRRIPLGVLALRSDDPSGSLVESLILAQDQRWRRA
jgi:hypothetical protein